jgi:hypothetical protein
MLSFLMVLDASQQALVGVASRVFSGGTKIFIIFFFFSSLFSLSSP